MNLEITLFLLPGLVLGLTIHEFSHAITAKWLGDSSAERMGRISLNPLRHLSPFGTLALFVFGFGWGKPVIVNLYNFKKPKLYYFLSSIAGPISNLILAAIALGVLYLRPNYILTYICMSVFFINVILACVNLVPIPPLDGSKIWPCLIPGLRPTVSAKWGKIWLVVLVLFLWTGGIRYVTGPVLDFLGRLLPAA